jgi:hypothetical protein
MQRVATMANRIDSILGGVADTLTVVEAWDKELGESDAVDTLRNLYLNIDKMHGTLMKREALIAVCCSVLNEHYDKSGWLFCWDIKRQQLKAYFTATDADRDTILSLMAG